MKNNDLTEDELLKLLQEDSKIYKIILKNGIFLEPNCDLFDVRFYVEKNLADFLKEYPSLEKEEIFDNINYLCLTPAIFASSNSGDLEILSYLKEKKFNFNFKNLICLTKAASYNLIKIVDFLFNQNIDIKSNNGEAINFAILNNHIDMIKTLLKNGETIFHDKLIYSSVSTGNIRITKFLIEKGFDIKNISDNLKYIAISYLKKDVLSLLIEKTGVVIENIEDFVLKSVKENNLNAIQFIVEQNIKIPNGILIEVAKEDNISMLPIITQNMNLTDVLVEKINSIPYVSKEFKSKLKNIQEKNYNQTINNDFLKKNIII